PDGNAAETVSLHQRIQRGIAAHDVSEYRISSIQMRLWRERDEVLAAARIRTAERHAHGATVIETTIQLIANGPRGCAIAVATVVTVLRDEIGNHTMERDAGIIAAARQREEILHRERRIRRIKLELDGAPHGLERDV